MGTQKLDQKLDQVDIKQTRPIRFKDESINKVRNENNWRYKKLKFKIQIKIQREELRVDGKKRDELQDAISAIKRIDIGLLVEFINFRD